MFSQSADKPAADQSDAPAGMRELPPQPAKPVMPGYAPTGPATPVAPEPPPAATVAAYDASPPATAAEPDYFGEFHRGGRGFKLASSPLGDVNISAWTYGRYLNQRALDDTYTDAFGRSSELDLRHDLQLQKIMVYFKGWMFDPKLRYMTYIWTSNTSQGLPAQVVLGGNLTYGFDEALTMGVGIGGLPSTRSTERSTRAPAPASDSRSLPASPRRPAWPGAGRSRSTPTPGLLRSVRPSPAASTRQGSLNSVEAPSRGARSSVSSTCCG